MIEAGDLPPPSARAHPVVLDVEYPEQLSRWKIFVKWLLAFPHYIILWLLSYVASLIAICAWFVILFTGRYPKGLFDIATGYLRWSSNVNSYVYLLRDEYPPFSMEPGTYPLLLDIPRAERQSRFRLFIRGFAILPNIIVFAFVQLAGAVATFIAWWAILFTGRYPHGLFRFNTGVLRWSQRLYSYMYVLRDEYPPYSIAADARPGNEAVSAIIGFPLAIVLVALYSFIWIGSFISDGETVQVSATPATANATIAREQPSGSGGGIEVTLTDYNPRAITPDGNVGVSFDVHIEKDRWLPALYLSFLFGLDYCDESTPAFERNSSRLSVDDVRGTKFKSFFIGDNGGADSVIYFAGPPTFCALEYFLLGDPIRFEFQ